MVERQRGFTLLEVLVAFVVLVLVFTVVLRIFANGARGVAQAQAHTQAVEYARARLAAAGREGTLQPGTVSGTTEDGYRWTLVAERATDGIAEAEGLSLLRVSVTVAWGAGDAQRSLRLWTLRLAERGAAGLGARRGERSRFAARAPRGQP